MYYTIVVRGADTEGNWCLNSAGKAYSTYAAAKKALDADPYAKPDAYSNRCYPEIVPIDADGYDSEGNALIKKSGFDQQGNLIVND